MIARVEQPIVLGPAERIPILMYHAVSPNSGTRFRKFVVSPERFEEQMEFLAASGFRVCSVSDLVKERQERAVGTHPLLGLTFDDAFQELVTYAVPVLERLGFGATVYVPTAFIGTSSRWLQRIGEGDRRIMCAEELRELPSSRIECGAHTHTHPALDTLNFVEVQAEIETSKKVLEETIEHPVQTFAYPFGYENGAVRLTVARVGYLSACRVNYALSSAREDVFRLSRLPVGGEMGIETFGSLVHGRGSLLGHKLRSIAWRSVRQGLARAGHARRRWVDV